MASDDALHRLIVGSLLYDRWEQAKGQLRACVAISGSRSTTAYDRSPGKPSYRLLEERVEAFIRDVEDEGLHEP